MERDPYGLFLLPFQKAKMLSNQNRAHKDHPCSRFQETRARCDGLKNACFVEIQRDWAIKLDPNRPMGEKKNPLQKGISNIFKRKFLVKKFLPVN
jgi:hypothetical protein